MHILYRRDDEKPVSDFLKSGVPAILVSVLVIGSLIACFVTRQKAKKKQQLEDARMGRESLDLELDVGPIYAQKPINSRSDIAQMGNAADPALGAQQQHRRTASRGRPGMHSRSTSVSLGYSGSEEGPLSHSVGKLPSAGDVSGEHRDVNGSQVSRTLPPPRQGKHPENASLDLGKGLLHHAEPMGRA